MEHPTFVSRIAPPALIGDRGPAYWFIFQEDKLLVRMDGEVAEPPLARDIAESGVTPLRREYLGYLEDGRGKQIDCYAAEIAATAPIPDGMTADGLRQLAAPLGETFFALAGRAVQMVAFDQTHRYCGRCGAHMERMAHERAQECPNCGLVGYPRLSPAIIIAVLRRTERGEEILLARNHRFPPGRYSVLAGYVEPGETLEECAQREVCEEVGINITHIRYFGSQPWPFPNSLMIGFTAEYESGELAVEEAELADARWFGADALPKLPPTTTIARQLIDWFVARQG